MEEDLLNKINQIESEESKSKRFTKIIIISIGIIILGVIVFFVISYLKGSSSKINNSLNTDAEENALANLQEKINQTANNANNQTNDDINNSNQSLNESDINNSSSENESIPNPIGSIKVTKIKCGEGEYFCNNVTNPEHRIRLYTYKIINSTKELSEEFIDSQKINNVCSYYENSSSGMNYYFKWEWDLIGGVDGYRIYQYYSFNTTQRNYNYYVDMDSDTGLLTDLGLDFWAPE